MGALVVSAAAIASFVGGVAISALAFLLIMLLFVVVMWGDDRAFIVGPIVSLVVISLFWLWLTGVIVIAT